MGAVSVMEPDNVVIRSVQEDATDPATNDAGLAIHSKVK